MKDYIETRVMDMARYALEKRCTVREAAYAFCVSKSTAHKDLSERLPQIDKQLYEKVCVILDTNWAERYLRGGEATKRKYKKRSQNNQKTLV